MRNVVAVIAAAAVVSQAGIRVAAAPAAGAAVSCVATHTFACGPEGCTRGDEASNGSVRLYLDLASGIGKLCEYTQCRGIAAARFGEGPAWTGQLALGPSSSIVMRSETVDDAELLPTLGALLGIDLTARTFMLSEQNGTQVSGYSGICDDGG